MRTKHFATAACVALLALSGCENTDLQLAAEAGKDAVKAVALSDRDLQQIAVESAAASDRKNALAPPSNPYALRLQGLVGPNLREGALKFNLGVYLSPEVNAFAMADGTIRLYSGLMDLLDDGEIRFVVGHEMGHVAKNHIRKRIRLAYAASAVRKGVASQNSTAGDVARSALGDLAQTLLNAQFSQVEEKEADDYGLAWLKREQFEPNAAVSGLKKLAGLGKDHSFLSSHPDPEARAERLLAQLEGRAVSIEDKQRGILAAIREFLEKNLPSLLGPLGKWLPGGA